MSVPSFSSQSIAARLIAVSRLVLFDLDDTLCDYARARHIRLRQAFALAFDQGTLSRERYPDFDQLIVESVAIHPHGADHFPELLGTYGLHEPAAREAQRWYRENRFHGLDFFAETIEILAELRKRDRLLGVITNGPAEVQRAKVELLEIERWVDFVIISGEFGVDKPDPRIFNAALAQADVTAAEAVFIGDSPAHDIAGAHAVSIPTVWMNPTRQEWPENAFAPDAAITSLSELVTWEHLHQPG